jgi:hypothetical protein
VILLLATVPGPLTPGAGVAVFASIVVVFLVHFLTQDIPR